jgi:L-rhamnose mutarotase
MKHLAFTVNLKDDPQVIKKYKEHHSAVWPEVIEALKEVGVIDMKIYLLGRRLFMVCEVIDSFEPQINFPEYLKKHPCCQQWENLMDTFQETVKEAPVGEKWAEMAEVFSLK